MNRWHNIYHLLEISFNEIRVASNILECSISVHIWVAGVSMVMKAAKQNRRHQYPTYANNIV